jgi:hypothetical protein
MIDPSAGSVHPSGCAAAVNDSHDSAAFSSREDLGVRHRFRFARLLLP